MVHRKKFHVNSFTLDYVRQRVIFSCLSVDNRKDTAMIKLESNKMQRAIDRAKAARPRVRVISADERTYSVTGSKGNTYTVKFVVVNGLKLAECNCAAGQASMMCYHVAGAAQVNVMVQSM